MDHMSNKLPISRWQRDLTDSTVLRNLGVGECGGAAPAPLLCSGSASFLCSVVLHRSNLGVGEWSRGHAIPPPVLWSLTQVVLHLSNPSCWGCSGAG